MNSKEFYDSVYSKDNQPGQAHGWLQWKGTNVCIDLHCKCGDLSHFDGDFFYFYKCKNCGAKYALGQNVKLIELSEDQIAHAEKSGVGFLEASDEHE